MGAGEGSIRAGPEIRSILHKDVVSVRHGQSKWAATGPMVIHSQSDHRRKSPHPHPPSDPLSG